MPSGGLNFTCSETAYVPTDCRERVRNIRGYIGGKRRACNGRLEGGFLYAARGIREFYLDTRKGRIFMFSYALGEIRGDILKRIMGGNVTGNLGVSP